MSTPPDVNSAANETPSDLSSSAQNGQQASGRPPYPPSDSIQSTEEHQENPSNLPPTKLSPSGNSQSLIENYWAEKPWTQLQKATVISEDRRGFYLVVTIALMGVGLILHWPWLGFVAAIAALFISLPIIIPIIKNWITAYFTPQERRKIIGFLGFVIAIAVLAEYVGVYRGITNWLTQFKYDEFGSWAEWVGALGQILIAVLAVYVAWQQYVISRDLTIKQNRITQQQTIDTYFQGISELVLDNQGMLEDWPQERAIADGRTAAILSSVDAGGKAKILRFLSQSRLLTPLMRDRRLGRPLLDGLGGYAEDREEGIRVINLGVILAGSNLVQTDLRWADLSEANMVHANLCGCDLAWTNLARTVLFEANLTGADLKGARLFYGTLETATPRRRSSQPDYKTGNHTGVVIEKAILTNVQNLNKEQHYYCCAWGGEATRQTIPGGCEGIPNLLER